MRFPLPSAFMMKDLAVLLEGVCHGARRAGWGES
jgi:hypothetical protein